MDAASLTEASFLNILRALEKQEGIFQVQPGEGWKQGRALFGGLVAALSVAAASRSFPDLPVMRSAQFAFLAPAAGILTFKPRLLRVGNSSAFVRVDARSDGQIVLNANLFYGSARRTSHSYRGLPMPEAASPNSLPEFFIGPPAPGFSRHFDGRFAGGAHVVSGAAEPEFLLWLRHHDEAAPDDVTSILALADMPPPGAMTMFTAPAPISTATWSIDVLADGFAGRAWHLAHVVADTVEDGYSSQRTTLWDGSGEPVLVARQTLALFA